MATALNKIAIPGMLVQFPDFFNLMYKNNNNLEEIIIWCIYLNWVCIASVITSTLIDGASSQIC